MTTITRALSPRWLLVGLAVLPLAAAAAVLAGSAGTGGPGARPDLAGAANLIGTTSPTVFAVVHNGSHTAVTTVSAGTAIHVQVTVSGPKGNPTGPGVTVSFWKNAICTGAATSTSRGTLSNGVADGIGSRAPNIAATYSFRARFAGDANYAAKDSSCITLKVTKINALASGQVHNALHFQLTTVRLGTFIHFKATVTGRAGIPSGKVVVPSFANATCTGSPYTNYSGVLGANGTVDIDAGLTVNVLGTRSFRVSYAGNGAYNAGVGPCQTFAVDKANPTVGAVVHNLLHQPVSEMIMGADQHPRAKISGPPAIALPTGRVWTSYWNTPDCSGTPFRVGDRVTLAGGIAEPAGPTISRPDPAVVSFQVQYAGDALYDPAKGSCQQMRWKPRLTLAGKVHNASHLAVLTVPVGSFVHPRVTASGSFGPVKANILVGWHLGWDCTGPSLTDQDSFFFTGALDTGYAVQQLDTGAYSFSIDLHGDATYLAAKACLNFNVYKVAAKFAPAIHNAGHYVTDGVGVGTTVHGYARVSSAAGMPPTGPVTFKSYTTKDCSGTATTNSATLAYGTAESPQKQTSLSPATMSWRMSYGGDSRYLPATGPCLTVTWRWYVIWISALHNSAHQAVTTALVGTAVHVNAALQETAGLAGDVTTRLYANGTCTGTGTLLGTYSLSSGKKDPAGGFTPQVVGAVSVRISYAGNFAYWQSTSPCMVLNVVAIAPPPPG